MNRNDLVGAGPGVAVSLATDDSWVRVLLGLTMLIGASLLDLRSRRVGNMYWYPFLALAAILLLGELLEGLRHGLISIAIAVGLCGLFYVLWWFGILFGGADAKGLMVLALLWPRYESGQVTALLPAVDVMVNGALATLLVPVALLAGNLARGRWAGLATFLATPRPLAQAQRLHVWPLQRAEQDGSLTWRYWQGRDEDQRLVYRDLERHGVDPVWVTPKVPFMVPLTVGVLGAGTVGNVVIWAMIQFL